MAQPGSYYQTNAVAVKEALCAHAVSMASEPGLFHCHLNMTSTEIQVEPGDILGLELPPRSGTGNHDEGTLAFASVSRGPTNYIFTRQSLSSSSGACLRRSNSVSHELPQITIQIGSGKNNNYTNSYYNVGHACMLGIS